MEEKNVLISPVILFLGHIQLTYFSRWSEVEDPCDSDAMERLYCAPGQHPGCTHLWGDCLGGHWVSVPQMCPPVGGWPGLGAGLVHP